MSKTVDQYVSLEYPFSVRPLVEDEGSGWLVEFDDLSGCIGTGNSIDEAINDAIAAKEAYISSLLADGKNIPLPGSASQYNGKFALRMPKSVHRWIDLSAKKEGISANQYVNHILSMAKGKKSL